MKIMPRTVSYTHLDVYKRQGLCSIGTPFIDAGIAKAQAGNRPKKAMAARMKRTAPSVHFQPGRPKRRRGRKKLKKNPRSPQRRRGRARERGQGPMLKQSWARAKTTLRGFRLVRNCARSLAASVGRARTPPGYRNAGERRPRLPDAAKASRSVLRYASEAWSEQMDGEGASQPDDPVPSAERPTEPRSP